jgi:hypothetical protein
MSCRFGSCSAEWCWLCGADITGAVHAHFERHCRQFGSRPGPPLPRAEAPPAPPDMDDAPLLGVRALFMQTALHSHRRDTLRHECEGALDALDEAVVPFRWCPARHGGASLCLRAGRGLLLLAPALLGGALALAFAALVYGAYAAVALPLAALVHFPLALACARGNAARARVASARAALHLAQACFVLLAAPFALLMAAVNADTLLVLAGHSLWSKWRTGRFNVETPIIFPVGGPTLFFFVLGNLALGVDQVPYELVRW